MTKPTDQYTPFYSKVIAANARDATYVLDGLLYHESDLRIEEHYTDTAGFTDQVFALCHLLGFRFAPRIRDLADKRLYVPDPHREYAALAPLVGGRLHVKLITAQWEEVLRLAASIRHGTVTASLIIRKLASYPRQNSLHAALREIGRMEAEARSSRAKQGRGEKRAGSGSILQPPRRTSRPNFRKSALQSQRVEPGRCRYRAMEHSLPKTRYRNASRGWPLD